METKTTKQTQKQLIMEYPNRNIVIIQEDKNDIVLRVEDNNKLVGYLCGSDIMLLLHKRQQ